MKPYRSRRRALVLLARRPETVEALGLEVRRLLADVGLDVGQGAALDLCHLLAVEAPARLRGLVALAEAVDVSAAAKGQG